VAVGAAASVAAAVGAGRSAASAAARAAVAVAAPGGEPARPLAAYRDGVTNLITEVFGS
jgi:hypothetical protein